MKNNLANSLSMSKIGKVPCEICFKYDEYCICGKCFQFYLEKNFLFRRDINSSKYLLRSAIQENLNKNNKVIQIYNKNSIKNLIYQKDSLKVLENSSFLKIRQNMIIILVDKIKNKKDNLNKLKDILAKQNNFLVTEKINIERLRHTNIELNFNLMDIKKYFLEKYIKIIFDPKDNSSEFFELSEYVKPDLRVAKSNKMEFKDFDNIPNVLSFSNSGSFRNPNNKEEVDIKYDNNIKIKSAILQNKNTILKLNQYIYKVIYFLIKISKTLNIILSCELFENFSYKIKNNFNSAEYNLYIDPNNKNYTEVMLNEIMTGYTYLDINIKYIKQYFGFDKNNLFNFTKLKDKNLDHNKFFTHFNPDINTFLNLTSLLPNYFTNVQIEVNKINQQTNKSQKIRKIENTFENVGVIKENKKWREDDGFLIIDNYYA